MFSDIEGGSWVFFLNGEICQSHKVSCNTNQVMLCKLNPQFHKGRRNHLYLKVANSNRSMHLIDLQPTTGILLVAWRAWGGGMHQGLAQLSHCILLLPPIYQIHWGKKSPRKSRISLACSRLTKSYLTWTLPPLPYFSTVRSTEAQVTKWIQLFEQWPQHPYT